jgi:uncharacterized membrane protein
MEDNTSTPPNLEELWQFAGQGIKSSDFNTAMVHFYRGELSRSNTWRQRLDATTNWAVIATGAALTFAFGSTQNTPLVIIINTWLILLFLFIEARRYRYYELWASRVRIMEQNFFAGLLSPPFLPGSEWANQISQSLHQPHFSISLLEALGRRYRRNYAPMFLILAVAWMAKIFIHPTHAVSVAEFVDRASFSVVSGWVTIGMGVVFHVTLMLMGIFTIGMQASTGEVFDEMGLAERLRNRWRLIMQEVLDVDRPLIPRLDRRKQMTIVITDQPERVGRALMAKLARGVTLLPGKGMYTGKDHGVLLCTYEARQLSKLKKLVHGADPHAFVIVTPVQGVHGGGFRPLEA